MCETDDWEEHFKRQSVFARRRARWRYSAFRPRSADWQSAGHELAGRAGCQPATQQIASLRYLSGQVRAAVSQGPVAIPSLLGRSSALCSPCEPERLLSPKKPDVAAPKMGPLGGCIPIHSCVAIVGSSQSARCRDCADTHPASSPGRKGKVRMSKTASTAKRRGKRTRKKVEIQLSAIEMKAAELCAERFNQGDVTAWCKAAVLRALELDLEDCPHFLTNAQPRKGK